MPVLWRRKKITFTAAGLVVVVAGLLAATSTRGSLSRLLAERPLLPVNAPLAPAAPGTRFAPESGGAPMSAPPQFTDLPPHSTGTHIAASLPRANGSRLVAVWGDSILWEKSENKDWRAATGLPRLTGPTSEVIALSEDPADRRITIHTRREGSYVSGGGSWKSLPRRNAPYNANAQALAAYRGDLFVATLNDGLAVRDEKSVWSRVAPPTISTNAPRQFLVWQNDLYLRHGSGVVDRFDGRRWTPDVFTRRLPRRQVSAMATDGDTLYLAQWGGWSETRDGVAFVSRFTADLKDLPITALLPTKQGLFVGTQGRGLAECDSGNGTVRRWHDERQGIGDDWVTSLAQSPNGRIVIGTFVSGAFSNTVDAAAPWQIVAGTENDCVTGTATASDRLIVALRRGGIRSLGSDSGETTVLSTLSEAQCLLPDKANHLVWIGTRTGIVAARAPE